MGFFLYTVLALVTLGTLRFVARRAQKLRATRAPDDPGRRQFIARVSAGTALSVATATVGYGVVTARGAIEVDESNVELARWPPALDGFAIVQLTDLHAGMTVDRGYVADVVDRANSAHPDLIVVTGDIADGSPDALREVVAPLAQLSAPHGVYYCTGNHDYYSGADAWLAELSALGMKPLRNQRVVIGTGAASFDLAGVDDYNSDRFGHGHGADLAAAAAGRDSQRELVLLAHQPRQFASAAEHGVGLQISGHTHGGQVWPFHLAVMIQQGGYLRGHYRRGDSQLYVSRGSGYWGLPIRVAAPPEIARLVLHQRS